MTSPTSAALIAIANLLDNAGIGEYVVGSTTRDPSLPMIVMKTLPPAPNRLIVLNMWSRGDNVAGAYSDIGMQIRTRGEQNNPFDADEIADLIYPVLNSVNQLTVAPGVVLSSLTRMTSVQNGQDNNRRYERFDQYYGVLSNTVSTYYS